MMNAPKRSRWRRGSASIEMALSATFMITAMFGIIDFGRMFATANMVSGAARAGTLYGGMDVTKYADFAGMANAARTDAQNTSGLTVTASQFCNCALGGASQTCSNNCPSGIKRTYIKVVASKTFSTAFQYPLVPGSTNLVSTSVMRVQ
jgi:Flp pilus assembly protein TadG